MSDWWNIESAPSLPFFALSDGRTITVEDGKIIEKKPPAPLADVQWRFSNSPSKAVFDLAAMDRLLQQIYARQEQDQEPANNLYMRYLDQTVTWGP